MLPRRGGRPGREGPARLPARHLPPRHRLRAPLELAAAKAGWGTPLPPGRGRGIACHTSFGSHVAEVAEVSVEAGKVRVHRVVAAVDCGWALNPDSVEHQIEGAVVYGLSAVLRGEITLEKGAVVQGNFDDQEPLRIHPQPSTPPPRWSRRHSSCAISKESLDPGLARALSERGFVTVPLPARLRDLGKLGLKACQQYADVVYAENLVVLDTGHAKLMTAYMPLDILRLVPGFERASYVDPYSGGVANSVRYTAMAPHDLALRATGVTNLFCGGEKAGPLVGHTEAICTGTLAGRNAALCAAGEEPVTLPPAIATGDAIQFVTEAQHTVIDAVRGRPKV